MTIKVYARDLKVGNVVEGQGRVTKLFRVAPAYYTSFFAKWADEPYFLGVRYAGRVGYSVTHAHEVVKLRSL